jgi:Zn-dependent protease
MSAEDPRFDERKIRNLRAVARHQAELGHKESGSDPVQKTDYKKWGALFVPVLFLFGKIKWLLALLKLTKLSTLLTMLLSVWAYGQIWGMRYALGFVLLIFIHEMGHMAVMKFLGIKTGAPVFIPFVGAVISMKELPKNAWVESLVGIGGPLLGTAGAAACLIVAVTTGSELWYALASTGFMINLFNMLPISPLDGGRITGVISRWFWLPGFALGFLIFIKTQSPILFLVLLFGFFSLMSSMKKQPPGYYDIAAGKRLTMGAAYFGLLFVMTLGMWFAEQPIKDLASHGIAGL